jgi:drug/metabolite transporter (DMT)-like permease
MMLNFASYQLLTVAPVALIWPLLASSSALVSVLAIIFLGERPRLWQGIGLGSILLGVMATTYVRSQVYEPAVGVAFFASEPGRSRADLIPKRAGAQTLLLAVVIALVSGIGLFFLIIQIKQYGWYVPFALERASQTTLALAMLAVGFPPRRDLKAHSLRWWAVLPLIGVFDGIGIASYGLGNQFGSTSITAMSSAAFVVVPVLLGVLLIGERPARTQWLGIVGVVAGLILIAV